MSTRSLTVLLIGSSVEDAWIKRIRASLGNTGRLDIVQKSQLLHQLSLFNYAIIILDEAELIDSPDLIRQTLQLQPSARVVVATHAPDWRRARRAFHGGASDYITTSVSAEDLTRVLQEI